MQMVVDIRVKASTPLSTFVKVAEQERADTGELFGKAVVDTPLAEEEEEEEEEEEHRHRHRHRHRHLAKFVAPVASMTPNLDRFVVNKITMKLIA